MELTGATNFRDIGGYRTEDGRRLRWRRVYRSDSLADLSETDIVTVSNLGLRTICDLRDISEYEAKPNRNSKHSSTITHHIGFLPHRAAELVAAARLPGATPVQFRIEVDEVYRRFAVQEIATFRRLFELIEEDDALPVLIHCTSGKDRTGFAVALILRTLGVPMSTVIKDYLLSNRYKRDLSYLAGEDMPLEMLTAMMQVHQSNLAAGFEAAQLRWGTYSNFLLEGLGLDIDKQKKLRMQLLE